MLLNRLGADVPVNAGSAAFGAPKIPVPDELAGSAALGAPKSPVLDELAGSAALGAPNSPVLAGWDVVVVPEPVAPEVGCENKLGVDAFSESAGFEPGNENVGLLAEASLPTSPNRGLLGCCAGCWLSAALAPNSPEADCAGCWFSLAF